MQASRKERKFFLEGIPNPASHTPCSTEHSLAFYITPSPCSAPDIPTCSDSASDFPSLSCSFLMLYPLALSRILASPCLALDVAHAPCFISDISLLPIIRLMSLPLGDSVALRSCCRHCFHLALYGELCFSLSHGVDSTSPLDSTESVILFFWLSGWCFNPLDSTLDFTLALKLCCDSLSDRAPTLEVAPPPRYAWEDSVCFMAFLHVVCWSVVQACDKAKLGASWVLLSMWFLTLFLIYVHAQVFCFVFLWVLRLIFFLFAVLYRHFRHTEFSPKDPGLGELIWVIT